jgi:DNA helicase HerA-like ATPase
MVKDIEKEAIGYIKLDPGIGELGPTECMMASVKDIKLERGTYVKITAGGNQFYVGQIIDGPYFIDSGRGQFETVYKVELNASIQDGLQTVVLDRPPPKTQAYFLDEKTLHEFLGMTGNLTIGRLATHEMMKVKMNSSVLTRHMGIFGTTGSGKSNTIQAMMEEAHKDGFAVLAFDIEGEYVMMDEPTESLTDLLSKFGYKPEGVKNFEVYVPYPSTSGRSNPTKFAISFKDVDRNVFSEVAGLNRMEQLYFLDLIDKVESVAPKFRKIELEAVIDRLRGRLRAQADNPTMPGYIAEAHTSLYSKLMIISGLGIVDTNAKSIDASNILLPGKVSIVDISDASNAVRNIVIANLLDSVFKHKMMHPDTPRLLIILEEAHAFISKQRREEMMATLSFLLEIARRGRKRGICLGIVTQQPGHLPSELLELCNLRVMHRMSSLANIQALEESTGGVPESLWKILPSLGQGESIIASPEYTRGIIAQIRPVAAKRLEYEYLRSRALSAEAAKA